MKFIIRSAALGALLLFSQTLAAPIAEGDVNTVADDFDGFSTAAVAGATGLLPFCGDITTQCRLSCACMTNSAGKQPKCENVQCNDACTCKAS